MIKEIVFPSRFWQSRALNGIIFRSRAFDFGGRKTKKPGYFFPKVKVEKLAYANHLISSIKWKTADLKTSVDFKNGFGFDFQLWFIFTKYWRQLLLVLHQMHSDSGTLKKVKSKMNWPMLFQNKSRQPFSIHVAPPRECIRDSA